MSNLDKIQKKRELEFSKVRLKNSLVKFKQQIEHTHEKLTNKYGKLTGTAMICVAVPLGITMGLLLPRATIATMVVKWEKKKES